MVEPVRLKTPSSPPHPLYLRGKLFNNLVEGVAQFTRLGGILESNKKFQLFFGTSKVLIDNPHFLGLLKMTKEQFSARLAAKPFDKIEGEGMVRDPDGKEFKASFVVDKAKRTFYCVVNKDPGRSAEALALSSVQQDLIALGETAGAIVHSMKGAVHRQRKALDLLGGQPAPDEFGRLFPVLDRSNARMLTVIKDVSGVGQAQDLDFSELDLRTLAEKVIGQDDIADKLQQSGTTVEIFGDCSPIEGVEAALREALVCLVDNAIDAIVETRRPDGRITITLRDLESPEGLENPSLKSVSLAISDNGTGIKPEELSHICSLRYTTKRKGSGWGLYGSKKAVEETHSGKLIIDSQLGSGSTFTLQLQQHPPRELLLRMSPDKAAKILSVQQRLVAEGYNRFLIDESRLLMEPEHIERNSENQLYKQIKGQIDHLLDFERTGQPQVLVNNFSTNRTEVVLTADIASTDIVRWEKIIDQELGRIKISGCIVKPTRRLQKGNVVCRIFEISKETSQGIDCLDGREIPILEKLLQDQLMAFPTNKEISAQTRFVRAVYALLPKLADPSSEPEGGLVSLIFSLSLKSRTPRLVGLRVKLLPSDGGQESSLEKRHLERRSIADPIFKGFISQLSSTDGIFNLNELVTPELLDKLDASINVRRIVSFNNVRSALVCAFPLPKQTFAVNLLVSSYSELIPPEIEAEFLAANLAWKSSV